MSRPPPQSRSTNLSAIAMVPEGHARTRWGRSIAGYLARQQQFAEEQFRLARQRIQGCCKTVIARSLSFAGEQLPAQGKPG